MPLFVQPVFRMHCESFLTYTETLLIHVYFKSLQILKL